ncbi:MAG TPA: hypothetical protein VMF06_20285, partial [Candidatus Limnocylindria bacterium]|nr:hypothetical protein [Candidatus Limnocylindria bacterium]
MTEFNSYRRSEDIGGPMAMGEGYRWNVPIVTYDFDSSFIDYFGTNGVAAVEEVIQILNDLPPASQIVLTNYSKTYIKGNNTAQLLGLLDLKSHALALLLEQMGLASPSRWIFSPGKFIFDPQKIDWPVLMRNYDPIFLSPTNSINGQEYVYQSRVFYAPPAGYFGGFLILAANTAYPLRTSASFLLQQVLHPPMLEGTVLLGLGQDDVGGLRYLLGTNNIQWETLLPGIHGFGTNSELANGALRPGVEKISFQRIGRNYGWAEGQPVATNVFVDRFWTNGVLHQQVVERYVMRPDFLFTATNCSPNLYARSGTGHWVNNGAVEGRDGPGVIQPPVTINFNPVSSHFATDLRVTDLIPQSIWGYFGISTNHPISYGRPAVSAGNSIFALYFLPNWSVSPAFSWKL